MLSRKGYETNLRLKEAGLLDGWLRRCPEFNFRRDFVAIQRRAFGRRICNFRNIRKIYITTMVEQLPEHFVMRLYGHNSLKTMTYYLGSRESYYKIAAETASKGIKMGTLGPQFVKRRPQSATSSMGCIGLELTTSCVSKGRSLYNSLSHINLYALFQH